MKLALIPPVPHLDSFEHTGMNMLLAHLFEHPGYVEHYLDRAIAYSDFNLLDNGAHEEDTVPSLGQMLDLGQKVSANEVVIPDVPHNSEATLNLFHGALEWLNSTSGTLAYSFANKPRLMFVPQALLESGIETYIELVLSMMADTVNKTWISSTQFTLGLPLMYDWFPDGGGLADIVDRAAAFAEQTGNQIHLLGWSRRMDTPIRIAKEFPSAVRSCDTCKPFVYAMKGIALSETLLPAQISPPYPGRPDDYFTRGMTVEEQYEANRNVNILKTLTFTASLPYLPERSDDMQETHR